MSTAVNKTERGGISKTLIRDATRVQGKVRDIYDLDSQLLLVTTDRLSAFDRAITSVPYKGQVLNQISDFWFKKTAAIINNHCLSLPKANAMLVKKAEVIKVEFVVRRYLTGTTNTSIWTLYQQGHREFGGITLPDGLKKNQALPEPIVTPTTKASDHDEPLTEALILKRNLMSKEEWLAAKAKVLAIFDLASDFVAERDLILVDTKFELGRDERGELVLVDEVLTPDSSRYWKKSTYEARLLAGEEPDNYDKEILRRWYRERCNPYEDEVIPEAPAELVKQMSDTYITLFEKITGNVFDKNLSVLTEEPVSVADII